MTHRATRRAAAAMLAGLCILVSAGCASTGGKPAGPSPVDLQRAWRVYVYGAGRVLVGVTSMPQHPADTTRPDAILDGIADAFCQPALDSSNTKADEGLRDFCQRSARGGGAARVVLAPDWNAAVPPYSGCFIHCVCEGRAPRSEDPAEQARESDTGPCSNRLDCRLDCSAG